MTTATAASFIRPLPKPETRHYASASPSPSSSSSYASCVARASSLNLKLLRVGSRRPIVLCNSGGRPGGSSSGESERRNVLDAFFLGKALAETLNERIESTVGEFLSTIGRLQAEQQKQVQDFQEEVSERAKRAKEKAARESMEAQGLIPKSTAADVTLVTDGAANSPQPPSSNMAPLNSYLELGTTSSGSPESEDLALDMSTEDE